MSLPELKRQHDELLKSIQNTQNTQKYMYERLDLLTSSPLVNNEEKDHILENIMNLQQTQSKLYSMLQSLYKKHSNLLGLTKTDIDSETLMIKVADDEIKQLKYNLNTLKNKKVMNDRMVKINTYEKNIYMSRINMAEIVTYGLTACLFVVVLQKLFLPGPIARILFLIIIFASVVLVGVKSLDTMQRDDFDYDKYKWDHPNMESNFNQNIINNKLDDQKRDQDNQCDK